MAHNNDTGVRGDFPDGGNTYSSRFLSHGGYAPVSDSAPIAGRPTKVSVRTIEEVLRGLDTLQAWQTLKPQLDHIQEVFGQSRKEVFEYTGFVPEEWRYFTKAEEKAFSTLLGEVAESMPQSDLVMPTIREFKDSSWLGLSPVNSRRIRRSIEGLPEGTLPEEVEEKLEAAAAIVNNASVSQRALTGKAGREIEEISGKFPPEIKEAVQTWLHLSNEYPPYDYWRKADRCFVTLTPQEFEQRKQELLFNLPENLAGIIEKKMSETDGVNKTLYGMCEQTLRQFVNPHDYLLQKGEEMEATVWPNGVPEDFNLRATAAMATMLRSGEVKTPSDAWGYINVMDEHELAMLMPVVRETGKDTGLTEDVVNQFLEAKSRKNIFPSFSFDMYKHMVSVHAPDPQEQKDEVANPYTTPRGRGRPSKNSIKPE